MSKLSELNKNKKLKILAYGEAGAGKTVFACGFPTPIFVFDFDCKVSSAANYYSGDPRLEEIDFELYPRSIDRQNRVFNEFYGKLVELEKSVQAGTFKYKTVVLDSLTSFYDQMMIEILLQNPNPKRARMGDTEAPLLQDYNIITHHFKNILTRVLALPAHVICTAHISTEKDDLTGELIRGPSITGKQLGPWLPKTFEEVYRVYVNDGKYLAQTRGDRQFRIARSQLRGTTSPMELSFKKLESLI